MKGIVEFLQLLQVAVKNLQLYEADHPRTVESLQKLEALAGGSLAEKSQFQLVASRGKVFLDGAPIEATGIHGAAFVRELSERNLSGFTFLRGVTGSELKLMAQMLAMKPQQLEAAGGAQQILSDAGVVHLRLSTVRYEELREDEMLVSGQTLSGIQAIAGLGGGTGGGRRSEADIFAAFLSQLTSRIADITRGAGVIVPPILSQLGIVAADRRSIAQGISEVQPEAAAIPSADVIRESVQLLPPEAQAALLAELPSFPEGEIRDVMAPMAPQLFASAVKGYAAKGIDSWTVFADMVAALLQFVPEKNSGIALLQAALAEAELDPERLAELLEMLKWEGMGVDARVQRTLEGRTVFDLAPERLLGFILQLIRSDRVEDANKLIEKYGSGLFADGTNLRAIVVDNFTRIAGWVHDPGLSPGTETLLEKLLMTSFLRESDPELQPRQTEALGVLFSNWIMKDVFDRVARDLQKLEAAVSAAAVPWKREAYDQLVGLLTSPERFNAVMAKLYSRDQETVNAQIHPYLATLGTRAAELLLESLEKEEDRSRRGRLVRAIRAIGRPAHQHLQKALVSPTWYLVRNALNLLADVGTIDLVDDVAVALKHHDVRVRRAAARALSKIGGGQSEHHLVEALADEDSETLNEVMLCLAAIKAESAVPTLVTMGKSRTISGADRVRIIEVLGQIGSPRAVPWLSELLVRRSRAAAQPVELRMASGKALMAIGGEDAQSALAQTLESEPAGPVRDTLERARAS